MTDATDWPKEWVEAVARGIEDLPEWSGPYEHAHAALTALAPFLRAERNRVREEGAREVDAIEIHDQGYEYKMGYSDALDAAAAALRAIKEGE